MAWILIPASAIFLDAYGAELLPVTYIGAAVAGAAASRSHRRLRRRPLVAVASRVLAGTAAALVVAWALLSWRSVRGSPSRLLVLAPIMVPVGLHASSSARPALLLDVRALKACYARVIAGFALGFVAGGLVAPVLLSAPRDGAENLCWRPRLAAGLWLLLLVCDAPPVPGPSCPPWSRTARPERRARPRATSSGTATWAHRRLPDAVGGREPVARLPRASTGPRPRYDDSRSSPASSAGSPPSPTAPTSCSSSSSLGCCCGGSGCATG